jgi:hypothetical protein
MADNVEKQSMTLDEGIEALVRRFDLIIGLLVEGPPEPGTEHNAEETSIRLARIGMRPVEIARLTGRHESNVNRDLSRARKDGRLPKISKARARPKSRPRGKRRKS